MICNAKRDEALKVRNFEKSYEIRQKSWAALEVAKDQGKCKFIGVSNYSAELLIEMKKYAQIMPAINQLEFHPRYASPELRRVATELGVVLIGYGTGNYATLSKNKQVEEISKKMGKTVNEVLLRWTTQSGVVVIPRSRSKDHLLENLNVNNFTLSNEGNFFFFFSCPFLFLSFLFFFVPGFFVVLIPVFFCFCAFFFLFFSRFLFLFLFISFLFADDSFFFFFFSFSFFFQFLIFHRHGNLRWIK